MTRSKGLQLLWWGWRDLLIWPPVKFYRYAHGLSFVYRWSLWIGPLEVRKWA